MTKIHAEKIVDHLRSQMRRALEDALRDVNPNVGINSSNLFSAFRRRLRSKCNTWETVPDQSVQSGEML